MIDENNKLPKTEFKPPKSLGAAADLLYKLRDQRRVAQRKVDTLESHEKFLKNYIIENLPKSDATGIAGKAARVRVITKEVAVVRDWTPFYAYVYEHKAFELMQRRVSDSAVAERWANGETVPGVEPFKVVSVSLTKI